MMNLMQKMNYLNEFNAEDELFKIKEIKTKPGFIYRFGNHILGCGDATDTHFVDRIIGSSKIDMVYLDPPYNISLDYSSGIAEER